MPGIAKVIIRGFEVSHINPEAHSFTAEVELAASFPQTHFYNFKIGGILSEEEREELNRLAAKVAERIKREFRDSLA